MLEHCPLNRTNKADLVASLDSATNVVREARTRDTGCVKVKTKENKRSNHNRHHYCPFQRRFDENARGP
jgi:hypothetical protein